MAKLTTTIPLFLSEKHSCSYLDDRIACSAFVHPSFELNNAFYSRLIERGFRRSGDYVYAPRCPQCQACTPARLPVAQFKPKRNQQRCLKKNQNTQTVIKPARFEQAHYDLYLRYQDSRHSDGSMAKSSPEEYLNFLGSRWCNTFFVEFLIDEQLIAVATIDRLDNALSAVYTFFDPDFSHLSPGMYAVLWQIEWAKQLKLDWLYLGFWIKDCRKMAYKIEYQPIELLIDNVWQAFDFSC
ncbi:arginyltransferase [Methylotuvimicrobium alcaliphilum]|uniref:Aspartate/glutamate leucyltransferase n=1 Tax=Methylotuvimicrobium alcaliphilum (strain DSM 19304 / NCIMB 14124 / VKM B-2133 / 20Z) TaxID=1091494 RepID=G4T2P3_META2|nr:arginyltransferase [Methylotuvimicrobium alcaliphilum]CCE22527.1 Putative arginyl-tRNA--protein transferase (R-transferase) (Arginyltransferase) Ate-like [Methylotuvimicrobium alcaliphilum 20Z]